MQFLTEKSIEIVCFHSLQGAWTWELHRMSDFSVQRTCIWKLHIFQAHGASKLVNAFGISGEAWEIRNSGIASPAFRWFGDPVYFAGVCCKSCSAWSLSCNCGGLEASGRQVSHRHWGDWIVRTVWAIFWVILISFIIDSLIFLCRSCSGERSNGRPGNGSWPRGLLIEGFQLGMSDSFIVDWSKW